MSATLESTTAAEIEARAVLPNCLTQEVGSPQRKAMIAIGTLIRKISRQPNPTNVGPDEGAAKKLADDRGETKCHARKC